MTDASPTTANAGLRCVQRMVRPYRFARAWALPNHDTLNIKPIREWVMSYLATAKCTADPFARDCEIAQWRNDLNPKTKAEYHLDALDFLKLLAAKNVSPDVVIFDPPYSRNQVKEMYEGIGRHYGARDTQYHTSNWSAERDVIAEIQPVNGIVLSFGWNTNGMCKGRGYEMIDVLAVAHGGSRNDTLCVAELKTNGANNCFQGTANL